MFPDHAEQQKKLALLGIAGGLGNVLGLLIAGVAMLHSYKAFFWIIAGICIVFVSPPPFSPSYFPLICSPGSH
jgi:MFS family permease